MPNSPRPDPSTPPVALTIAGSDSGGGAGIQADLLTFSAHGVFGTSAISAVTAQNTQGVQKISVLSEEMVAAQINSVLADFSVVAVKTGMLATTGIIELITDLAKEGQLPMLVVDPVMVATTGARLVDEQARSAYLRLLPYVEVLTPNLFEAEFLLERPVRSIKEMEIAAKMFHDLGVKFPLVKGGHLQSEVAVDVLFADETPIHLNAPMITTKNVHGTGCTLSAAISANLANNLAPIDAMTSAKDYVTNCLVSSMGWRLGHGPGPLNHRMEP